MARRIQRYPNISFGQAGRLYNTWISRRFIGRDVTIVSEKSFPGEVEGYSEYYLWTEGRMRGNKVLERDSFVVVHVEGCHWDGDRVVLSGGVAT